MWYNLKCDITFAQQYYKLCSGLVDSDKKAIIYCLLIFLFASKNTHRTRLSVISD